MFAHIPDFELLINNRRAADMAQLMNEIIRVLDDTAGKYDVCRIKTKNIGSCMMAAGLYNGANVIVNVSPPLRVNQIISRKKPIRFSFDSFQKSTISSDDSRGIHTRSLELNAAEIIAYLSLDLLEAMDSLINPITEKPFDIKIG